MGLERINAHFPLHGIKIKPGQRFAKQPEARVLTRAKRIINEKINQEDALLPQSAKCAWSQRQRLVRKQNIGLISHRGIKNKPVELPHLRAELSTKANLVYNAGYREMLICPDNPGAIQAHALQGIPTPQTCRARVCFSHNV